MNDRQSGWPSKPTNPANPEGNLASSASLAGDAEAKSRDAKGRFLTGNSGGGRKKGSRNRLTETFLSAVESDFSQHGLEALAQLRANDPAAYLRIIAALIPRDLILKREQEPDFSELSEEQLAELMWRAWRNASVLKTLKGVEDQ